MAKIKKRMRVFLRFTNYYRAFIDKFVTTVALFIALTGKYPFFWTPKVQKTFENLKKNLISAPILAQFNLKKETRLRADWSSYTAGGALL